MSLRIFRNPFHCKLGKIQSQITKIIGFNDKVKFLPQIWMVAYSTPGAPGSGAGKGGGAGGSIRESGGGLGQFGTAQEEQFFFNKQREQLEELKKKLKEAKPGELSQKKEK